MYDVHGGQWLLQSEVSLKSDFTVYRLHSTVLTALIQV